MIRVLHVLCDLAGGGAERLVLDLCRSSRGRLDAAVVTLHEGGPLAPLFEREGIPVTCVRRTRGRLGLRATARLAALLRGVDVVHTHLWAGDTWGRIAAGLARPPVVVTTEHNTRAEAGWRRRVSVGLSPLSDVVVCVSEASARVMRQAGVAPSRLRVIPNGVELARFSPAPARAGRVKRALAWGRLTRQKGFDVALRALALCPELELTLAGEGEEAPTLRELAKGLGGRVHLIGWQQDVPGLLARADLAVIPSRWEGFGLVAVEAMAAGVPLVACRVDGLEEVVGEAGLLVPPEDPEALAQGLDRLSRDEALRSELRARGLERARRFELGRTARAYEDLYRGLRDARP